MRSKVANILDRDDIVKDQNITKEEFEGTNKLKKDETIIMILPADKGRFTVVMNKKEYEKCQKLLCDR